MVTYVVSLKPHHLQSRWDVQYCTHIIAHTLYIASVLHYTLEMYMMCRYADISTKCRKLGSSHHDSRVCARVCLCVRLCVRCLHACMLFNRRARNTRNVRTWPRSAILRRKRSGWRNAPQEWVGNRGRRQVSEETSVSDRG